MLGGVLLCCCQSGADTEMICDRALTAVTAVLGITLQSPIVTSIYTIFEEVSFPLFC